MEDGGLVDMRFEILSGLAISEVHNPWYMCLIWRHVNLTRAYDMLEPRENTRLLNTLNISLK